MDANITTKFCRQREGVVSGQKGTRRGASGERARVVTSPLRQQRLPQDERGAPVGNRPAARRVRPHQRVELHRIHARLQRPLSPLAGVASSEAGRGFHLSHARIALVSPPPPQAPRVSRLASSSTNAWCDSKAKLTVLYGEQCCMRKRAAAY